MSWLALYHFDDVASGTVVDVSGNGYHIDLTGTTGAQVSGMDTGAFGKTGAGTVELPAGLLAASESDDRTLMFDALGLRSVWWVRWQSASLDTGVWGILSLDAANLITRARTQANGSPTPTNSVIGALSGSVRHHHAITYVRSTGVLSRYYDGALVGTQTFTPGTQLYVGADALDMGEWASTGPAIDNLRIADHAADAAEIAALAGTPVVATVEITGTATGSGGGTGTALGVRERVGAATGTAGGAGAATGVREVAGTQPVPGGGQAAAAGAAELVGVATGTGGGAGAATAVREVLATATGSGGGVGHADGPTTSHDVQLTASLALQDSPTASLGDRRWTATLGSQP